MTAEDNLIFQRCINESLFKYEIPFMFAGCAAIYTLGRRRLIVPRLWKYTAALYLGTVAGTMSYVGKIEEKIVKSNLKIPFSNLVRQQFQNGREPKQIFKECQKEYLYQQELLILGESIVVFTAFLYDQITLFHNERSTVSLRHKVRRNLNLCSPLILITCVMLLFYWPRYKELKLAESYLDTPNGLEYEKGREALPFTMDHLATIGPTMTESDTRGFALEDQAEREWSAFDPDTQVEPELDLGQFWNKS